MKKQLFLLLLFSMSCALNAQIGKFIGPLKIKKIDLMFGHDSDRIINFNGNYFIDQLKGDEDFPFDQVVFTNQDIVAKSYENPHFRFGLTLGIPKYDRLEWRNAINWMPNRIEKIYSDENLPGEYSYDDASSYLYLKQFQDEIAIESAILYRLVDKSKSGGAGFKVYTGIGSNAGLSYNNRIQIYGRNIDQIEGIVLRNELELSHSDSHGFNGAYNISDYRYYSGDKLKTIPQFNHRLFAQAGLSVIIMHRIELGVYFKAGLGYRVTKDAPTKFTNLISRSLSLRYLLK